MKWILRSSILMLLLWGGNIAAQPWHYNILWQREGAHDSSHYGSQILSLGDQNNDGFTDWAVRASALGRTNQFVEFFHGSELPNQNPYLVIRTDTTTQWDFPYFFPSGDLNDDGFIDWVCAFRPVDDHHVFVQQIYFGGPNADTIPELVFRTSWDVFFSAIGDYNADGYDDLWGWDWRIPDNYIYFGGEVIDSIPDLHMPAHYYARGDLNGDRFTDLEIGDYATDNARFYYGGSSPDTLARYTWQGFPYSHIDIVNDLNNDGVDELVLIPNALTSVNIHMGRNDSLSRTPDFILNYSMGFRCFSLGDINEDGFNDFAVEQQNGEGFAVFLGHPWLNPNPALTVSMRTGPLFLPGIAWVAGLGDINGDGINDMGIGSTSGDTDGQRGRALILSGDSTYHVAVDDPFILHPSSFILSVFPNPFNPSTTISFTLSRAGEVKMAVYDVLGRITDGHVRAMSLQAGEHRIAFNGSALPSGVYFVRVEAGERVAIEKMLLLK